LTELNNAKGTCNQHLADKIASIRKNSFKKKKEYTIEQLQKPVAFWTKKDRLLHEQGKEFTIILKTKGCSWSLGDLGGCSMCGYSQDAHLKEVKPEYIINQFDYALQSKIAEIDKDKNNWILKIFNSGSFFDNNELKNEVRTYIYEEISKINKIREVVFESRIEYISQNMLDELSDYLNGKYIEIGIGLETTDDYIRNNYINKGILFEAFKNIFNLCKSKNVGIRTYLLFKPLFLNEQAAIDDLIKSITTLVNMKVNTISINPMNIQKGSLVEYLWYQNRYRPPWFYSLLKSIKRSFKRLNQGSVRIVSDPSGAGTKRGIHNCLNRKCNEYYKEFLNQYVLTQDLTKLKHITNRCDCKKIYYLQRRFH